MKRIASDAHCIKFSKLDLENKTAVARLSWSTLTKYKMNVIGFSNTGDIILEPVGLTKEKVRYHVQPEDGQFKIEEWLIAVTEVVNA